MKKVKLSLFATISNECIGTSTAISPDGEQVLPGEKVNGSPLVRKSVEFALFTYLQTKACRALAFLSLLLLGQYTGVLGQNPLAPASKFNVFLASDATLSTNESDGSVAIGGNLTVAGNYQVATHGSSFATNGYPVGLVVGKGVTLKNGILQVNSNTYAKIGACNGNSATDALKVWYKDGNGAYSTMRVTKSMAGYNSASYILINTNANDLTVNESPVCADNIVDFSSAFTALKANSLNLAQNTNNITLSTANGDPINAANMPAQVYINLNSSINVWNVNGTDLNKIQTLTYSNDGNKRPSANHILIINVNAMGAFTWNTFNQSAVGNGAPYILWNFYNTTNLTIGGSATIAGSLLAPFADVTKTENQANIDGQLVANSLIHSGGEMHLFPFNANITTVPPTAITISGSVFNDSNGLTDGVVNGTLVNSLSDNTFSANLIGANGNVLATTTLTSGSYSFTGVTPNASYSIVLSNYPGTIGAAPPSTTLANGVVNTGENIGTTAGSDGTPNGSILVNLTDKDVDEVNFGVERLPTAKTITASSQPNPGGTNKVTVPTLNGSDPEDGIYDGSVADKNTVIIKSLPTNATLYYKNLAATNQQVITNYDPGKLTLDPNDGAITVTFTYAERDAAGKDSPPATVTMPFSNIPDLVPIIYARASTVYNTTPITVVVDVAEILGVATSGVIKVRVTKSTKVSLSYDPSALTVGGRMVSNGSWTLDNSNGAYYLLTSKSGVSVGAKTKLSFGFTGTLTPGATSGTLTLTSTIEGGSGGEVRTNNNSDADKIDFFQQ